MRCAEAKAKGYDPAPMLPRHAPSHPAPKARRQALNRALRGWLTAPGSLTARLRLHGVVTVQVQSQGRQRLWPQERRALGASVGHVREVVLRVDGRPAVWARSSTPLGAVKGPWRAIKGLGQRPLAELLFTHRRVLRDPLWSEALGATGPAHAHLLRQWQTGLACPALADAAPRWARRSVFWHQGQPLQVLEAFAPWLQGLCATGGSSGLPYT